MYFPGFLNPIKFCSIKMSKSTTSFILNQKCVFYDVHIYFVLFVYCYRAPRCTEYKTYITIILSAILGTNC